MTKILECLEESNGNYVLPFFWQHGESEEVLRSYMRAIHGANIQAVCLEARPHQDYAGEGWFHDVDIILDEAKKLDMKIWILDDAHFPSGQCGGKMLQESVELQKQYLKYRASELTGPTKDVSVPVGLMAKEFKNPFAARSFFDQGEKIWYDDDRLLAVIAARMDGKNKNLHHLDENLLDLTAFVKDGILEWDVPAGNWKLFVLYTTRNNGGRTGYVNMMSKASCRKQIEHCYEPHCSRYKEEFGRTILGFFSDEPEVGNVIGYDALNSTIGNMDMPIPWSDEMAVLMEERFGKDYLKKTIALWMPVGSDTFTAEVRIGYMDLATRLCKENFSGQIGEWCREHGVQYIGHIVEDNDQHVRLGSSQGHFFRALWGQDWSGIDNINGQVTVGGANIAHGGFLGKYGDGAFYHQTLGKLGTSLADIDPKKKGRSMCEIFGAYGWREGTRMMKYEMDHFLVRGINHYVPHAFSPKAFPDPDCPPHFYAHGKNPLYCSVQGDVTEVENLMKQYGKPVLMDEFGYEGNIFCHWGHLSPFEEVHRFWLCCTMGGYGTHGETYMNDTDTLWWGKGGKLVGQSPKRIGFHREILESLSGALEPVASSFVTVEELLAIKNGEDQREQDDFLRAVLRQPIERAVEIVKSIGKDVRIYTGHCGENEYLAYYGRHCTAEGDMKLPENHTYDIEVIDVWEMTRKTILTGVNGKVQFALPGKEGIAVLAKRTDL